MRELDVRYTSTLDYNALVDILKDDETISNFPFSKENEMPAAARNWVGFSKLKASLTGVVDGEIVSFATLFLMPYKKLDHHAMFYIVVKKEFRRKGIGSSMLKNLLNLAKSYFKLEGVYIEVFEGSKIVPLLKKFGFNQFANQQMYVKEKKIYKNRILFDKWF
ncbi:MAG: hypothetical protein K1060chlam5_00799 [Candidatus Anoxychlamydiales bacterium]|nr:hypothetical protein [Candidatus Anoxychlamydiales bacterium]